MAKQPLIKSISEAQRMSYRIGRGEQGVLTFEPYKSSLLPLWRFRTPDIARQSASDLWDRFIDFDGQDDFVGMDMTRKFIQMGFTRSRRYANHAGGRKYDKSTGAEIPKSAEHKGRAGKEASAKIFQEVLERCKAHQGYQEKKVVFLKQQKEWLKDNPEEHGTQAKS